MSGADELVVAVQEQQIGQSIPVQVVRSGRTVDITVTPTSDA